MMTVVAMIFDRVMGWLRALPDWAWWLLLAVGAGVGVDMRARAQERERAKAERERLKAEAAEQRRADEQRTVETVQQIEKEARNDADEALAARDSSPVYSGPDSVPDAIAKRIFRD